MYSLGPRRDPDVPLAALKRRRVDGRLLPVKLRAIDIACKRYGCGTLADLGGVWAVDGGYALYAVDRLGVEKATICDEDFTKPLLDRSGRDSRLRLVHGNFASLEASEEVGPADAILLFDVLLHQVAPDWDEVLSLYADRARCLVIAGPWWTGPQTVRLFDLGREEYLANVPVPEFHASILDQIDDFNERRGRPWRDCHDIWQWGITDGSLRRVLSELGFRLAYHENLGAWRGLPRFDDCSYVFVRDGL